MKEGDHINAKNRTIRSQQLFGLFSVVGGILALSIWGTALTKGTRIDTHAQTINQTYVVSGPLQTPQGYECNQDVNLVSNISPASPSGNYKGGQTDLIYRWGCSLPIDSKAAGHKVYCTDVYGKPMNGDDSSAVITKNSLILPPGKSTSLPNPVDWGSPDQYGTWEIHYTVHATDSSGNYYGANWSVWCKAKPTPAPTCKVPVTKIGGFDPVSGTNGATTLQITEYSGKKGLYSFALSPSLSNKLAFGTSDLVTGAGETYDFYISNMDGTPNPDGVAVTSKMHRNKVAYDANSGNNIDSMVIVDNATGAKYPAKLVTYLIQGKSLTSLFADDSSNGLGLPDGKFTHLGDPDSTVTYCFK